MPVDVDQPDEETEPDLIETDLPRSTDAQLQDYLTKQRLLDSSYVISLYRYDNEHTQQKTFCGKYVDMIPSEHDIGLEHGSGKYLSVLQAIDKFGKRRGTTSSYKIDKRYDILREQNKMMPESNYPALYHGGNGMQGVGEAMKIMQSMVAMLIPLIRPSQQPQSMSDVMSENFKSMNDVMKNVYMDNAQFYNDIIREKSDISEVVESEEEASGFMGILNQITPLIETLLPKITARGQQSVDAVNTIKSIPGYKQVIRDAKVIKGLIDFIKEKHGAETAVKVARKFNIKIPEKKGVKK